MALVFNFVIIFVTLSVGYCSSCINPEIISETFTTQDATIVTNVAYVSEFQIKCKTGTATNLYADIEGSIVPVSVVGIDIYQVSLQLIIVPILEEKTWCFQISWTEDTKVATRGDKVVRLFDEDGIALIRKALREGDDIGGVPALTNVVINYPGAFNGPWLKSEFLAVLSSLVIAYVAITSRSKLIS